MSMSVIIKGKRYSSIEEASKATGYSEYRIREHLLFGRSLKPGGNGRHVVIGDKTYDSLGEAMFYTGRSSRDIKFYAEHGQWPVHRAITNKVFRQPLMIAGVTYPNYYEASKKFGISVEELSRRLHRSQAINGTEMRQHSLFPMVISGHQYHSYNELGRVLHRSGGWVKYTLNRMFKNGEKITLDALLIKTHRKMKYLPVTIRGKTYWDYDDIVKDYPYLNEGIVKQRLYVHKIGSLDPEKLIRPIRSVNHPIEIDGRRFESVVEASKYYHQSYVGFWGKYKMYKNGEITEKQLISKEHE